VEKKAETKRITSFTLERPGEGGELDSGLFARIKLTNGLIRSYSIVGGTTTRFQLGIALEENSRGGSRYLHEKIQQGDKILVGKFTESVPYSGQSSNHLFIAGVCIFLSLSPRFYIFHILLYNQQFSIPKFQYLWYVG
jgi:ferredoxin-NADP reductase